MGELLSELIGFLFSGLGFNWGKRRVAKRQMREVLSGIPVTIVVSARLSAEASWSEGQLTLGRQEATFVSKKSRLSIKRNCLFERTIDFDTESNPPYRSDASVCQGGWSGNAKTTYAVFNYDMATLRSWVNQGS
jgi:hypothetical protein